MQLARRVPVAHYSSQRALNTSLRLRPTEWDPPKSPIDSDDWACLRRPYRIYQIQALSPVVGTSFPFQVHTFLTFSLISHALYALIIACIILPCNALLLFQEPLPKVHPPVFLSEDRILSFSLPEERCRFDGYLGSIHLKLLSWPLIKQSCNPGYRSLRQLSKIRFTFEHITNQEVRVFTGALFPGWMRVAEIDLHFDRTCQTLMLRHLFPLVKGNAFHQLRFECL